MQKRPLLTLKKTGTERQTPAAPGPGAARKKNAGGAQFKASQNAPQHRTNSPPRGKPAPQASARAALPDEPLTPLARLRAGNLQPQEWPLPALPEPALPQDALAFQLFGAACALARVQAGGALPEALQDVFALCQAEAATRGAIQDLAHRGLRRFGTAQVILAQLTAKAPGPELLYALATLSLALLLEDPAPYAPFTLVDQAVRLAGQHAAISHGKGMLNAVLRRFLREKDSILADVAADPLAQHNYPDWWVQAMRSAWGTQAEAIMAAGNLPPPMVLRVNQRRSTRDAALALLQQQGLACSAIGAQGVRLMRPLPVQQIPGFADGLFSVQDAAAQLAAPLLEVADGMRVLDACAAPGGKSGHLLELADIELTALDVDAQRLARVADNLQRLQLPAAQLLRGDACRRDWWDGRPFARILADLPCTASGIVRRHPDIRWLRRADDADRLAALSARILNNLWDMLEPGGRLLLVTCSLWPQESEQQAAAFAARRPDARRLPAPGQLLPVAALPENAALDGITTQIDQDGLFYALFEKSAA